MDDSGVEKTACLVMAHSYEAAARFVGSLRDGALPPGIRLVSIPTGAGKTEAFVGYGAVFVPDRLLAAGDRLRLARTPVDRRAAVREFLAALAELVSHLLSLVARTLLFLLSRSRDLSYVEEIAEWKPEPIDASPQIKPRGPNLAFPVTTYRGGHRSSALGNAVLAA